jgi:hypothetical protein
MINKISSANQVQYQKTNKKQNINFGKRYFLMAPITEFLTPDGNKCQLKMEDFIVDFIKNAFNNNHEMVELSKNKESNTKIISIDTFKMPDEDINYEGAAVFTNWDAIEISNAKSTEELEDMILSPTEKSTFTTINLKGPVSELGNFICKIFEDLGIKNKEVLINDFHNGFKDYLVDGKHKLAITKDVLN